jgi:predicted aldo/keto reductase-like oxidoreductase
MSLLLRRAPTKTGLDDAFVPEMEKVNDCTGCNHCEDNCPYGLKVRDLLKKNYEDYKTFL